MHGAGLDQNAVPGLGSKLVQQCLNILSFHRGGEFLTPHSLFKPE